MAVFKYKDSNGEIKSLLNMVGPQGPEGPQGIQGPAGPQGPQGEKGEAGTTNYEELDNKPVIPIVENSLDSDSTTSAPSINAVNRAINKDEIINIFSGSVSSDEVISLSSDLSTLGLLKGFIFRLKYSGYNNVVTFFVPLTSFKVDFDSNEFINSNVFIGVPLTATSNLVLHCIPSEHITNTSMRFNISDTNYEIKKIWAIK